jgi:hypothetical protein
MSDFEDSDDDAHAGNEEEEEFSKAAILNVDVGSSLTVRTTQAASGRVATYHQS